MLREDAKSKIRNTYKNTQTDDIVNKIYDDFENRRCENCIFMQNNECDIRKEYGSVIDRGCSNWDKPDD